ncbi:MAG TPA: hypothetical protein VMH23_00600, partial [Bacteroidota bacterium]|nr:hypothetical protein [Bacteroidota bacterium]
YTTVTLHTRIGGNCMNGAELLVKSATTSGIEVPDYAAGVQIDFGAVIVESDRYPIFFPCFWVLHTPPFFYRIFSDHLKRPEHVHSVRSTLCRSKDTRTMMLPQVMLRK